MSEIGERKNAGKLRWRNVPLFLLEPLMEVGAAGEKKYATFNFLKGMKINDCMDSMKRHMMKLESPFEPDEDEESGVSHAAHIAWNALVICYMLKTRPDLDDRYAGEEIEKS
jgi:hypothetical protein